MAHWREEYSAALTARDRREKANVALYNACMSYKHYRYEDSRSDNLSIIYQIPNLQIVQQKLPPPQQMPNNTYVPLPQRINLQGIRQDLQTLLCRMR